MIRADLDPLLVRRAAELLADATLDEEEKERRVSALVSDPLLARRLLDCIPEGFALVLASRLDVGGKAELPRVFSVPAADGEYREVAVDREPVLVAAVLLALEIYHDGPQALFQGVCERSGLVTAINNALNEGGRLKDTKLGLKFFGIPAEFYDV